MDLVKVGQIVNTQGIKGEVRVISQTDFPDQRFKKGNLLYVKDKGTTVSLTIKSHRVHKQFHLLSFLDHLSINDVEKYKGSFLSVALDQLDSDELKEDEFYYSDIIGLTVLDEKGNEQGKVKEILALPANDVWVVEDQHQNEWMLPYIEEVIKKVDLTSRVVHIEMMEGLKDED